MKQAYIEQVALDHGAKVVFKEFADHVRVAYDPDQISPLDARGVLGIYVHYTESPEIDRIRDAGSTAEDENCREFYSIILGEIDRTGDAPGIVRHVLGLMEQAHSEERGR
ncbi:hypothetical protein Q5762_13955 [Streptomyces sp. P9(2023)]|uniref:hypothetical protein n=1 Tax=Streptomyces sp. P9(2023) TaxID=3064394 RepID=UPI0028F3E3B6|nr:hypothetical protein [Streptomyces sp. P9(2023)]MDT9689421.1 hypothetical protein [Streptomyces sp. P9(2023)]